MDDALYLELPLPPSLNQSYGVTCIKGRGQMYAKKEVKAWKQQVADICALHDLEPLEGWFEMTVWVYFAKRGCDLDNRLKALKDALEGFAYRNDRSCARLTVIRGLDRKHPRLEVRVEKMGYSE